MFSVFSRITNSPTYGKHNGKLLKRLWGAHAPSNSLDQKKKNTNRHKLERMGKKNNNNKETHKPEKNPTTITKKHPQPEVVSLWAMRVKNLSPVDCNFRSLNKNIINNLPVLFPQLLSCSLKNLLVACLSGFLKGQEIGSFAVSNQY